MDKQTLANFQTAMSDRFVLDRELGRGGMGVVFQARDVRLGRQVAIKLLRPEVAQRLGETGFNREIRYTARLQHPHILPLLEAGETNGLLYFVTPYVKGGSLRDLLDKEGSLGMDQAVRLAREVGSALECAHDQRIVHCDIKPENILYSDGMAMLADFGIARSIIADQVEWRKKDADSFGTPVYVSPEQASGESVDQRSDIYSLACVIYETLVGKPPFDGDTVQAIIAKRFTDSPPLISSARREVPLATSIAVARALEPDPRDRYPSVKRFVVALADSVETRARSSAAGGRGFFRGLLDLLSGNRLMAQHSGAVIEGPRTA